MDAETIGSRVATGVSLLRDGQASETARLAEMQTKLTGHPLLKFLGRRRPPKLTSMPEYVRWSPGTTTEWCCGKVRSSHLGDDPRLPLQARTAMAVYCKATGIPLSAWQNAIVSCPDEGLLDVALAVRLTDARAALTEGGTLSRRWCSLEARMIVSCHTIARGASHRLISGMPVTADLLEAEIAEALIDLGEAVELRYAGAVHELGWPENLLETISSFQPDLSGPWRTRWRSAEQLIADATRTLYAPQHERGREIVLFHAIEQEASRFIERWEGYRRVWGWRT